MEQGTHFQGKLKVIVDPSLFLRATPSFLTDTWNPIDTTVITESPIKREKSRDRRCR